MAGNRAKEREVCDPELLRQVFGGDFIIDAGHQKMLAQDIHDFYSDAAPRTISILNGLYTDAPMCAKWNIVVGSQKWKELAIAGRSQFKDTPWEQQYGANINPLPEESIVAVIPWATSADFYCPDSYEKDDYFLWFCYDEKTELLTKQGWKAFKDITYEDKIFTMNPDTEEAEYHHPVGIQCFPYDGDMLHFHGKSHDLLVTPNHSMFCRVGSGRIPYSRHFKFMEARDLRQLVINRTLNSKPEFSRLVKWAGNDRPYFTLPQVEYAVPRKLPKEAYIEAELLRTQGLSYRKIAKLISEKYGDIHVMSLWGVLNSGPKIKRWVWEERNIDMDLWLRFFGWWIAEGWVDGRKNKYQIGISQCNEERKAEIKQVIEDMGYKYWGNGNDVCFSDKQLALYLRQFGKAKDKWIPEWIKSLPPQRLEILLQTLVKGDGSRQGNTISYFTFSKKLSDDVQEIAAKAGYSATISTSQTVGRNKQYCVVIGTKSLTPRICNVPEIARYKGYVYDVTVPNHIIYVRRNGKALWSGNSRPTPYKGLGKAIQLAIETGIHLKLAMPMEIPEHQYFGQQYLIQIEEAREKKANIEVVKLHGDSRHHTEKRELYRKAKALLVTVEAHEPFGLTLIEAMACGCPVIASKMGAFPEILTSDTGFLCADDDRFKEAIAQVGLISPDDCRRNVLDRFDRMVVAPQYIQLYENLMMKYHGHIPKH